MRLVPTLPVAPTMTTRILRVALPGPGSADTLPGVKRNKWPERRCSPLGPPTFSDRATRQDALEAGRLYARVARDASGLTTSMGARRSRARESRAPRRPDDAIALLSVSLPERGYSTRLTRPASGAQGV